MLEKSVKYNSTMNITIQVYLFMLRKGEDNVNSIYSLYIYFIRRENSNYEKQLWYKITFSVSCFPYQNQQSTHQKDLIISACTF